MIWKILVGIFVAIIAALILVWVLSGGVSRSVATAHTYPNLVNWIFGIGASSSAAFVLPGEPQVLGAPLGVNASTTEAQEQLLELQLQYQTLQMQAQARAAGIDPNQ